MAELQSVLKEEDLVEVKYWLADVAKGKRRPPPEVIKKLGLENYPPDMIAEKLGLLEWYKAYREHLQRSSEPKPTVERLSAQAVRRRAQEYEEKKAFYAALVKRFSDERWAQQLRDRIIKPRRTDRRQLNVRVPTQLCEEIEYLIAAVNRMYGVNLNMTSLIEMLLACAIPVLREIVEEASMLDSAASTPLALSDTADPPASKLASLLAGVSESKRSQSKASSLN